MTNEELAKAARQGNQGALPQLWEATRALLFAFAWKFYTRQGKDRCAQRGVALETEREAADRLTGAQQDLEDALGQQLELLLQAWPQQGDLSPHSLPVGVPIVWNTFPEIQQNAGACVQAILNSGTSGA